MKLQVYNGHVKLQIAHVCTKDKYFPYNTV